MSQDKIRYWRNKFYMSERSIETRNVKIDKLKNQKEELKFIIEKQSRLLESIKSKVDRFSIDFTEFEIKEIKEGI